MFKNRKSRKELVEEVEMYKELYCNTHSKYFFYMEAVTSMCKDGLISWENRNEIEERYKDMYEDWKRRNRA